MSELEKKIDPNLIDVPEFSKRMLEWAKINGPLVQELTNRGEDNPLSWGGVLEQNAQKYPDNPAIKFEDTTLTHKQFNEKVNQYANYFTSLGLKKGDVAKVLIKNRIEFLLVYTANAKLGVISSLINTDLRKRTLVHSLNLTPGKIVVIGEECFDAFSKVRSDLDFSDTEQLCFIPDKGNIEVPNGFNELPKIIEDFSIENPANTKNIGGLDIIAYIFTSGTTGLPKAALLTHNRVVGGGYLFGSMVAGFTPDDTIYIPLPFFHGTALMTGWSSTYVNGGALALARKFSVHQFWDDIRRYNATGFNYVGEICRYLMNQPPKPDDADNPVRAIIGNGLRPEIWLDFKKRFDIERIGEFYGSSEGNGAFANILNFDLTCGYTSGSYALVQYNHEEDKPIRNENGFMEKVDSGGIGLLLFESAEGSEFIGYTDKNATEAKLYHNVFKEGDTWFNTGDLMRDQGCNHTQFIDRLGDTFRWKGHNVSTTEVEQVINVFDHVSMASVYGVKIPLTDGRAGMTAIVPTSSVSDFDFEGLAKLLNDNLAPYAIPILLRFKTGLSITHTFKFKKVELKKEGFNPETIEDPLYVMLPNTSKYTLLTKEIYEKIEKKEYQF
ncbi:MAG: long-chain-acyl-CoA synthetase [Promethearchaeota archaeon]|jgi:citronellyl-CoA synthetase